MKKLTKNSIITKRLDRKSKRASVEAYAAVSWCAPDYCYIMCGNNAALSLSNPNAYQAGLGAS